MQKKLEISSILENHLHKLFVTYFYWLKKDHTSYHIQVILKIKVFLVRSIFRFLKENQGVFNPKGSNIV